MTTIILDGRHIQDHFPGIGRYVFNLARGLAQVATDDRIRLLFNPRVRNTRFDISSLASFANVELVGVGAATWSFQEQLLGLDARVVGNASLWHSAYYVMPYRLSVPSVVTLEDIMPLVIRESMPRALNRLVYRALNLAAARRATRIITLSHAAAADIRRVLGLPGSKIKVVALAADPAFCPRKLAEIAQLRERMNLPGRYALYLGSNKPHKNLERLVEAWKSVAADAALVIAGHWDPRFSEAKRLVQSADLAERVQFRENVSAQDLPALISGAHVFVFPSLYEGFGLPPLEAMACGTPVVCSNASSLPEVVGDAALLFNPFDLGGIASALTRVLEDNALRDSLRAQGLARAMHFSWELTARETWNVYRAVVGGQGAVGGGQGTVVRGQEAEDGGRRTEDEGRGSEDSSV